MKILFTLFILSFSLLSFSENLTPNAASNSDLRGENEVFSMNNGESFFSLKKLGENEYQLIKNEKGNIVRQKISSQNALAIDEEFVSFFIGAKYGALNEKEQKKCSSKDFTLTMRGEKHIFCLDRLDTNKKQTWLKLLSYFQVSL